MKKLHLYLVLFILIMSLAISVVYAAGGIGGGFGINITVTGQGTDDSGQNTSSGQQGNIEIDISSYIKDEKRDENVAFTGESIVFDVSLSEDVDYVEVEIDGNSYGCDGKDDKDDEWSCEFKIEENLKGNYKLKINVEKDDIKTSKKENWDFNPDLVVNVPSNKNQWDSVKNDVDEIVKLNSDVITFEGVDYLKVEVV